MTKVNLDQFMRQVEEKTGPSIELDEGAQNWLKRNLDIDIGTLKALSRPKTATIVQLRQNTALPLRNPFENDDKSVKSVMRPTTSAGEKKDLPKGILKPASFELIKKKIKMWIRAKSLLSDDVIYII